MKYSEVLGKRYHLIKLTPSNQFFVDIHFTAGAHHILRFKEAHVGSLQENFHDDLFRRHLYRMMEIVYISADFQMAQDGTGFNLHRRESWRPDRSRTELPEPRLFAGMSKPDERFGLGCSHISDRLLEDGKLELPIDYLLKSWGYTT